MAEFSALLKHMDYAGGEIMLMAVRYGDGWYCLVCPCEPEQIVRDKWADLTGGDADHGEAMNYFSAHKDCCLCIAADPAAALNAALQMAAERMLTERAK